MKKNYLNAERILDDYFENGWPLRWHHILRLKWILLRARLDSRFRAGRNFVSLSSFAANRRPLLIGDARRVIVIGAERRRATDGQAAERMAWLSLLLEMTGVFVVYGATAGLEKVFQDNQAFLSSVPLLGWSVVAMTLGLMVVTTVWAIRLAWRSWRMALQGGVRWGS